MELLFFTTDVHTAVQAEKAGIHSIIVDWETKGKDLRQHGYRLETNADTAEDVAFLSARLSIPVTVRINPFGPHTPAEIESALRNGARILMLPMAASTGEVVQFLSLVCGRAKTIIQIETPQLAAQVHELKKLRWDYAYIGLNDLMVARGGRFIWEAVLDGTVERICVALAGRKYGFGGATVIGGGEPLPGTLIMHELVRLGCSLTFMRRTFRKELLDRDIAAELKALRSFITCSMRRGKTARQQDRETLYQAIIRLMPLPAKDLPGGYNAKKYFAHV